MSKKVDIPCQCPECGRKFTHTEEFSTKVSITPMRVKKTAPKCPREALLAILSTYLKAKNMPMNDFNMKIHGKHAKSLYFDMDKSVQECMDLITKGANYFKDKGLDWSWNALKNNKDSINEALKSQYTGW